MRYVPIVEEDYPEIVENNGITYYRFWCRPFFIVYEKIKNNVILGYYVLPVQKDIFTFQSMISHAEQINSGETLCKPMREQSTKAT